VDIHLKGLEALGVNLDLIDGYVHAKAPKGLKGTTYELPFASVGATENLLMAATLAKGTTILKNVAREPEIVDLAVLLRSMGANISGDGSTEIIIEGVETLHGTTHKVVTDRIELGTYMMAPLIAGGEIELLGGKRQILESFCQKLEEAGAQITETTRGLIVARKNANIHAVNVTTEPFPGFPTDLQAQMMALLCTAEGTSVLNETIFENRFMHAPELVRMGANIDVQGGTATVTGVKKLRGAPVMATDLRASVSLILAGLAAKGETRVARVYHLDRGYEKVVSKFRSIGANIERIKE
jgi:UDP-N-acetylglucosamine 1-carboxyvinyltransferase